MRQLINLRVSDSLEGDVIVFRTLLSTEVSGPFGAVLRRTREVLGVSSRT